MTIRIAPALADAMLNALDPIIAGGAEIRIAVRADDPDYLAAVPIPQAGVRAAEDGVKCLISEPLIGEAAKGGMARVFQVYGHDQLYWSGTVTLKGGGGDMILDSVDIKAGQKITIHKLDVCFCVKPKD